VLIVQLKEFSVKQLLKMGSLVLVKVKLLNGMPEVENALAQNQPKFQLVTLLLPVLTAKTMQP